ncbi:ABC transporter permease subunit [Hydrogenoanaerobacterium sp.]|uniref:ABC transporter permease subunit n=1 Tax=Hydrogenoanaerobacterium sp. TaxID=2953763 RepID=UPI0028A0D3AC|nr:ABC transporter permease [Hydrogenoanaerobacterium sp.]
MTPLQNKKTNNQFKDSFTHFLSQNMVVIVFLVLGVGGFFLSKQPLSFVLEELVNRFARNTFLVLSLIIPVVAGMGLNFGIVIGAMAGQMAIISAVHWGFTGFGGFLLTLLLSMPFAILFGYLTGKILNKTKGNEMITTMILGFFANGIYQFIYLFLVGRVIPMENPVMMINSGAGIKNTVDLTGTLKYSLDGCLKLSMDKTVTIVLAAVITLAVFQIVRHLLKIKRDGVSVSQKLLIKNIAMVVLSIAFLAFVASNRKFKMMLAFVDIPVATMAAIALLCLINVLIMRIKLGQDFRTIGQNGAVAQVAGINVDRTRIIAIILSTIFSAWGQIIYLQNIGTLNTYASHEQVGTFAVAAIVVGGASVAKATNKQAIIGVLLFHLLFIVSPLAGKELFNDPQIGEYFRVFIAYGVISVSLALHAWKVMANNKKQERLI